MTKKHYPHTEIYHHLFSYLSFRHINTNNEKNRPINLLDDYFNYSKKVNI